MTDTNAWSARRHLVIGFIGLAVLIMGFGSWAVITQISGAIVASGRFEVDQIRNGFQQGDCAF